MIELFEQDIKTNDRQSSKGNQLKWFNNKSWYKADYTGYEGLSEYMVSHLLRNSSLTEDSFILYETEEISYREKKYLGCSSKDFRNEGYELITLERLFNQAYGKSFYKSIYSIAGVEERIQFAVEQTQKITGLTNFGEYLSVLLTVDALFLNEDRHMHNIAVQMNAAGDFFLCPVFDNGAALLSDTLMDYPMELDIETLVNRVQAKTFCSNFDEQLDTIEKLYGRHVRFHFNRNDMIQLLQKETYYPQEVKERVEQILLRQRRKYEYLFY